GGLARCGLHKFDMAEHINNRSEEISMRVILGLLLLNDPCFLGLLAVLVEPNLEKHLLLPKTVRVDGRALGHQLCDNPLRLPDTDVIRIRWFTSVGFLPIELNLREESVRRL